MSDIRIVTYRSENADAGREWIAFLVEPNGSYLPAYFRGASEAEASGAASAEWEKHREVREANIARREEGRRKAAETRARKSEVNTAHKFSKTED